MAACITDTAMLRWSKTAFNDLNCSRERMRSNRCGSVSLTGGSWKSVAVAGFLVIKFFGSETILEPARWARTKRVSLMTAGKSMIHLRAMVPEPIVANETLALAGTRRDR